MSAEGTKSSDPLKITLVTSNYPFEGHPNVGTFVAAIAEAWAREGESVRVIAPLPVWSRQHKHFTWRHPTWQGTGKPTVLRPAYMSYSSVRIGPFSTHRWTTRSFDRAVQRSQRRESWAPDIVYSHFLFPAGWSGLRLARRMGRPAVVALGESGFEYVESMQGRSRVAETVRAFDGILSVSEENAQIVIDRYGADPARIEIFPNAVDTERFRPRDRTEMRNKLGLPQDAFIVSFTGHFIDRKGPLRVLDAIRRVPGAQGVFLGEGPERPQGARVLHAGRVGHSEVPEWLCASDVFVLPTLAEGSPNAIIEAMACGLPVVSSNIPALRETVDDSAAILVDPMDLDAIAQAIESLARDESSRRRLAEGALRLGRRTTLADRARRIRTWMSSIVEPK